MALSLEDFQNGAVVTPRDLYDELGKLRESTDQKLETLRKEQNEALRNAREEQRQDLRDMEGRLMTALDGVVGEFRSWTSSHADEHKRLEQTGTPALAAHLEATRLAEAKKQGEQKVKEEQRQMIGKAAVFVKANWQQILLVLAFIGALFADIDITTLMPH